MAKRSSTFEGSSGNGRGSYLSEWVLTPFCLKNPGALTWRISQVPLHNSGKSTPFKHLPHNPVSSEGSQVTLQDICVPSESLHVTRQNVMAPRSLFSHPAQ